VRRIHALPGVPTNFSQVIEDDVEEALSGVKGEIAIKIHGPDGDPGRVPPCARPANSRGEARSI
jgi:Cu/Ag efflux pump CusA